jgi:membrane-bound metal-dependent hydrolase YbcI (DUF457 family)
MLALSHVASGLLAGMAVGEAARLPLTGVAALSALTGGFAALNDLDCVHSCAARSLGFASAGFAYLVRLVSGGHRHATHSLLGAGVFTAFAWAACRFRHDPAGRAVLAAFLLLAVAAGLRALRLNGHIADLLGLGAAAGIALTGWELALVPLAAGLGALTHIAGDCLTDVGCPLAWPLSLRHFGLPRALAFTTGHAVERYAVDPLIMAGLAILAVRVADPAVLALAVSQIVALA